MKILEILDIWIISRKFSKFREVVTVRENHILNGNLTDLPCKNHISQVFRFSKKLICMPIGSNERAHWAGLNEKQKQSKCCKLDVPEIFKATTSYIEISNFQSDKFWNEICIISTLIVLRLSEGLLQNFWQLKILVNCRNHLSFKPEVFVQQI